MSAATGLLDSQEWLSDPITLPQVRSSRLLEPASPASPRSRWQPVGNLAGLTNLDLPPHKDAQLLESTRVKSPTPKTSVNSRDWAAGQATFASASAVGGSGTSIEPRLNPKAQASWYPQEQESASGTSRRLPVPSQTGHSSLQLRTADLSIRRAAPESRAYAQPVRKASGGIFSRVPLVLILGLLASLSYVGYTAATRSIAAFQESWQKTDVNSSRDSSAPRNGLTQSPSASAHANPSTRS